jgi:hypothetical protein
VVPVRVMLELHGHSYLCRSECTLALGRISRRSTLECIFITGGHSCSFKLNLSRIKLDVSGEDRENKPLTQCCLKPHDVAPFLGS